MSVTALDAEIVNKLTKVPALISFQSGSQNRHKANEQINKQESYQMVVMCEGN